MNEYESWLSWFWSWLFVDHIIYTHSAQPPVAPLLFQYFTPSLTHSFKTHPRYCQPFSLYQTTPGRGSNRVNTILKHAQLIGKVACVLFWRLFIYLNRPEAATGISVLSKIFFSQLRSLNFVAWSCATAAWSPSTPSAPRPRSADRKVSDSWTWTII